MAMSYFQITTQIAFSEHRQVKRETKKRTVCLGAMTLGGWCQRDGLRNNNNRKAGSCCSTGKTHGLSVLEKRTKHGRCR